LSCTGLSLHARRTRTKRRRVQIMKLLTGQGSATPVTSLSLPIFFPDHCSQTHSTYVFPYDERPNIITTPTSTTRVLV
jgi:hypothetical protein